MEAPHYFSNVRSKVGGMYAHKGELILNSGVIYYFPQIDLLREKTSASLAVGIVGHVLGGAVGGLLGSAVGGAMCTIDEPQRSVEPRLSMQHLSEWKRSRVDSQTLQERLDRRIEACNVSRRRIPSALWAPCPERYAADDIQEIGATSSGHLVFETRYVKCEYAVGLFRRRKLIHCLQIGGFLK